MSTFELIHGSCVDENVDALVNAANAYLSAGGGVCGAIFEKAGYEQLTAACRKINTPLVDGEAVITPAFNLKNARCIIHAVGPDFRYTPGAFDKLYDAYYNSLTVLMENGLHSISFPLISAGIYSGNLERPAFISAQSCLRAYNDFKKMHPDYEIDLSLCAFSAGEYSEACKCLE